MQRAGARLNARPDLAARVELVRGEAEHLPFADGEFDALTFGYLLRYVDDPAQTMRELARVVKPGGRIASLDFAVPEARLPKALWLFYTRARPTRARATGVEGLVRGRPLPGPSISGFSGLYPLQRLREIWADAGIDSIRLQRLSLGGGLVMSGVKGDGR